MSDMPSVRAWEEIPHRVIYGDTDAMGVVYYANYLRFVEMARNEFLRRRGATYRDMESDGYMLPVSDVRMKYLAPARYDDELIVGIRVQTLKRVSITFDYEIRRLEDSRVLAQGETTHACVDRATCKVCRFPERVRELIERAPNLTEDV